jgi:hypothetical protein
MAKAGAKTRRCLVMKLYDVRVELVVETYVPAVEAEDRRRAFSAAKKREGLAVRFNSATSALGDFISF